uniref:Uncharacterized protein n=1 Tax=Dictyoglomus turgidum TaxID=513050 RepID=A0A7C3SN22_9BACT
MAKERKASYDCKVINQWESNGNETNYEVEVSQDGNPLAVFVIQLNNDANPPETHQEAIKTHVTNRLALMKMEQKSVVQKPVVSDFTINEADVEGANNPLGLPIEGIR